MKRRLLIYIVRPALLIAFALSLCPTEVRANVIEEQLQEIGSIPNEETVVVQRKYTRKPWRREFTPVMLGGVPFGTVRKSLFGGAGYTLHFNDWLGWEMLSFVYTKTFFTNFTSDVNKGQIGSGTTCLEGAERPCINVDYQKLLYFLTTGFEISPFYGKLSTFSRFIAYAEPYIYLGGGLARTETNNYLVAVPGIGLRVFFKEWFSMRFEFRDYIYTEKFVQRSNGQDTSALRNNYAFMLSLSFWLPKMPAN